MGIYADALPRLVQTGMQIPVSWAHDKLRIPLPVKGDAILSTVQPAISGAAAARTAALKTEHPSDPLDDFAEQLAGDWQPVADMVAPAQALLASCKSLEEFRTRLSEVIPQLATNQLADLIAQPPKEAIEYFRQKGFAIGFDYRDVWQEQHQAAFTVAKVTQLDLLQDIRAAVDAALKDGTTLQHFQKTLTPTCRPRVSEGQWQRIQDDKEAFPSCSTTAPTPNIRACITVPGTAWCCR